MSFIIDLVEISVPQVHFRVCLCARVCVCVGVYVLCVWECMFCVCGCVCLFVCVGEFVCVCACVTELVERVYCTDTLTKFSPTVIG